MRIIGVGVGILIVLDFFATLAFGQVADSVKSAKSPWPVDQRCGVIAAHGFNQAYLNCGAVEGQKQFIEQSKGFRIHEEHIGVPPAAQREPVVTQPRRD
jgi:hypothetical protein